MASEPAAWRISIPTRDGRPDPTLAAHRAEARRPEVGRPTRAEELGQQVQVLRRRLQRLQERRERVRPSSPPAELTAAIEGAETALLELAEIRATLAAAEAADPGE